MNQEGKKKEGERNEGSIILDASALLAVIFDEKGAEVVYPHLLSSKISAVNLSEVASAAVKKGGESTDVIKYLSSLSLDVIPFDTDHAFKAASLEPLRKRFNLSLGDRACLSCGLLMNLPILTAEQGWRKLSLSVDVRVIR